MSRADWCGWQSTRDRASHSTGLRSDASRPPVPTLHAVLLIVATTARCAADCGCRSGEASAPEDYLWLFSRVAGYRPVIEYCGGTEIGGGFVTGTLVQVVMH